MFLRVLALGAVSLGALATKAADESPPLVAVYQLISTAEKQAEPGPPVEWELHRSANCVVVNNASLRVAEVWRRDEAQRVWYRRVFHGHKKIIEYQPADLRLGGVTAEWARIESITDPAMLLQLTLQPTQTRFDGRDVSVYQGGIDGASWEVSWLQDERLPVRLRIEHNKRSTELRLLELMAATESADGADACGLAGVEGYEAIDFADLGDRHGDPFVEALMKYEGLSHGHAGAH